MVTDEFDFRGGDQLTAADLHVPVLFPRSRLAADGDSVGDKCSGLQRKMVSLPISKRPRERHGPGLKGENRKSLQRGSLQSSESVQEKLISFIHTPFLTFDPW